MSLPAALTVLTALTAGLFGCHRAAPRAGDREALELVVTTDPETLDPRYVIDAISMRATRLVHAGLFRLDPDTLAPVPYLAASYAWEAPLALRVSLREDVHFHSGAPFRAADVVATLTALRSKSLAPRQAHAVDAIDHVDAISEHEIRLVLRRPRATLLTDLELPILRADEALRPTTDRGASLDGLGPYRVVAFTQGALSLVPAEGGAAIAHAPVVVRTVHDENARALRITGGRTDIAQNVLSPTLLPAAERSEAGLSIVSHAGANLTYVLCRVDAGPFSSEAMRQGLSLGTDRALLVRSMLSGRGTIARGILPPALWATPLDRAPLPFDPDRARALFATEHPTPRRPIALMTSTDRSRLAIARIIAERWTDLGLETRLEPLELGTLLGRLWRGDFDAAILQMPEIADPNVLRVFLHSTSIPPTGSNRGRIRDAEVDALLDEGDRTVDPEARKRTYRALELVLRERFYFVPLWHEDYIAVRSARGRGYMPSADGRWLGLLSVE